METSAAACCQAASPGLNEAGYVTHLRDRAAFVKAVNSARSAYEKRRRRFPALCREDYTTVAAGVLRKSFWPFRDYPYCVIVNRATRYPCEIEFPRRFAIDIPRHPGSHWDFLHQLTHWCLPLEGHNEHFCSLYAALVHALFGRDGSRRLCRAYEEFGIGYSPEWQEPITPRAEFLHPFVSARHQVRSDDAEDCAGDAALRRVGT